MNNVEASVATAPATGEGVSATGLDLQNQVSNFRDAIFPFLTVKNVGIFIVTIVLILFHLSPPLARSCGCLARAWPPLLSTRNFGGTIVAARWRSKRHFRTGSPGWQQRDDECRDSSTHRHSPFRSATSLSCTKTCRCMVKVLLKRFALVTY